MPAASLPNAPDEKKKSKIEKNRRAKRELSPIAKAILFVGIGVGAILIVGVISAAGTR